MDGILNSLMMYLEISIDRVYWVNFIYEFKGRSKFANASGSIIFAKISNPTTILGPGLLK